MFDPRRFTAVGADVKQDKATDGSTISVVEVNDPNALTQTLGHVRFAAGSGATTLFRGAARPHRGLVPSGYRQGSSAAYRTDFATEMYQYLDSILDGSCACGLLKGSGVKSRCRRDWPCPEVHMASGVNGLVPQTPRAAVEPLLQHYGFRTRWLDVVDNVWVALWFSCHEQITHSSGTFAHHTKRSVAQEPEGHAYIDVLVVRNLQTTVVHGLLRGDEARVADLRAAVPSVYLRPHAQHGLLVSDWSSATERNPDLARLMAARLRIRLNDALMWLGEGGMISPYTLFPPATRDEGYRRLLEYAPQAPERLGRITHYGPGI